MYLPGNIPLQIRTPVLIATVMLLSACGGGEEQATGTESKVLGAESGTIAETSGVTEDTTSGSTGSTSGGSTGSTSGGSTGSTSGGSTGSTSGGSTGSTSGGSTGSGTSGTAVSITSTQPAEYTWNSLTVGEKTFTDRDITYTSIPTDYLNYKVLQTANDDKASSGNAFVSFDISAATTIYVGHDQRLTSKPAWLSSWSNTNAVISTNDATYSIFKKDVTTSSVEVGGNEGASGSMYFVFLNADSASGSGSTSGSTGSSTGGSTGGGSTGGSTGGSSITSIPLGVSWDPNADTVLGYRIYYGLNASSAVSNADNGSSANLLATKSIADSGFNPTAPSLSIDAMDAPINASTGDQVCFSIVAYNSGGSSPASDSACLTL